jgi:N-acetylmuramoyl-L-alanine amidase
VRALVVIAAVTTAVCLAAGPAATSAAHRTTPRGGPLVVLNPGHNGANGSHASEINRLVPAGFGQDKACDTTGTETNAGYPEHAYTWDVALRTERILQHHGVRVVLTRADDHGVGPCVDTRAYIGNYEYVAAVVSIHGDGAPSSGHGFFVNTASRRPDGASAVVMQQNTMLARQLRNALVQHSGLPVSNYLGTNGIYATAKFAALNLATRPAAFLEIGNMRNAGDAKRQSSAKGRQHIAVGIATGILAYMRRR